MRDFWDRRARENAWFFIDDRLDYRTPDLRAFWAGGERDLDALLDAVDVQIAPTDTVVEIGCGAGRLTRPIAARAGRAIALDVSPEMLSLAREHNRGLANVTWILGDGRSLAGIEDASAEACISYVVFQHVPDPNAILGYVREMGRVLRPGGWAAFQLSNDPTAHRGRSWLRERLLALRGPRGRTRPEWLGSAVDLGELRRTAGAAGMAVDCLAGEGSRFCAVLVRRRSGAAGVGDR